MDNNGKKETLIKRFLRQMQELFVSFFIFPTDFNGDITKPTRNLVISGVKKLSFKLAHSLIVTIFAFMLKIANNAVANKMFLIGIVLYILYEVQPIMYDFKHRFEIKLNTQYSLNLDNAIWLKGGKVVATTSGRVRKYYNDLGIYKIMTNEEISYCVKKYMQGYWELIIGYPFDLLSGVVALVTAIVAVYTNNVIDSGLFIISIIISTLLSFITSCYRCFYRNDFNVNIRKSNNKQSLIVGDLLRVPLIVKPDLEMRLNKLEEYIKTNSKLNLNFSKGRNMTDILMSVIHSGLNIFFIISYVSRIGLNNITLADITQISATLAILNTLIQKVSGLPYLMEERHTHYSDFSVEKEDFKEIIKVYQLIADTENQEKSVDKISLKPFRIKYQEESLNDRPFTLVSNEYIDFTLGDIVLLTGPSGSGKSTFINLITDRIALEKSDDLPATSRALIYDEKMRFGSLSLYEEIFCCSSTPDLDKMRYILENLHLWQELQSNCLDVWQWMKEKSFNNALSNGQKQRMIVAKMLYFVDLSIDIIALDECTSGLDEVDAERVLGFITEYVSKERERIIIISTHQAINEYVSNVSKKHRVHFLRFERVAEENIINPV